MVQLMNSGNIRPESEKPCRNKFPVKLEFEDSLDEEHGPFNKRSKLSSSFRQQWSTGPSAFPIPPSQYNPLDEPSPLGLCLKKSPSFLDLIQMKLYQGNASTLGAIYNENLCSGKKKDPKGATGSSTIDKLKASNFPASLLRIGTWERVSRYEGDLVAKCYFAKHKLVWEVLEDGLKSKIEIQWSDIMALKANCPENEPGTLDIVLARQPLFFKETNPQPRKHTLWQATSDFTGGQASIHRESYGRAGVLWDPGVPPYDSYGQKVIKNCPPGLLSRHFEKLIQCDPRLSILSQQPEIVLDSPFFEPKVTVFEDPDESKSHGFDSLKSDYESTFSGLGEAASPSAAQLSSIKGELLDSVSRAQHLSRETTPSSVEENGNSRTEGLKRISHWDQFKVPVLHSSMSMSDLVSHIGQCISEQMTAGTSLLSSKGTRDILEDITQYLFSDSQLTAASDEQSLMSRVNSFCCLLQKDPATVQNSQVKCQGSAEGPDDGRGYLNSTFESAYESKVIGDFSAPEGRSNDVSIYKQRPAMSRKHSVGDLLLHLPRIASLPQFLFNISEDFDNQAR